MGAVAVSLAAAAETNDTVQAQSPRQLKEVEVLGVKQMPTAGSSPVTRITASLVRRLDIDAVKDIGEIVPNFYTPNYGSRMTSSIYMRGLGSRIDQAVVGLNIDGVPFLNKDAYDTDLPDISSIEVVRGAQSLLNGRNSMGGQINIHTLSPRDFQGVRAMLQYGRANSVKASLGGYFKISEGLFTSVSSYYTHTDGFWRNAFSGSRVGTDNAGTVRWKTVFFPSGHHSVTNTAAFSVSRQSGYPYALTRTGRIAYNDTCFYRRNAFSDGLTVAWAGKRVVVTSLTSVQYLDDNMTLDQDFTPADYFTLTQRRHEWTFTEDLFAKGRRGRYSWLGGVFGFTRDSRMKAPVTFYSTGIARLIEEKRNEMNPAYPIKWDGDVFPLLSDFTTRSRGVALYHESSYDLGNWTFEAGLRWDYEHVSCRYRSDADASYTVYKMLDNGDREFYRTTDVSIHDNGRLSQDFNELLPKVSVTYRFSSGEVYANFAKGYKSGGFNTQMFSDVLQQRVMETMGLSMPYKVSDIVTYKPEESLNYEIGGRCDLADGRVRMSATAFLISCRNQQLTVFPPGLVTGRIMTNAGRTRSAGFEFSATLRPLSGLTIITNYGYTNAVFRTYNNGRADFRGKRVPYAPAHTLFVSGQYDLPFDVFGCRPTLAANVRAAGDIYWNEENSLSQPFYAVAGASLTFARNVWSLKLWGENITGTRYDTFYFMSMGNSFTQRGVPATWGVTLRLSLDTTAK